MITCMSAVVRVMFPALPEDTSSSLAPFFLYLDNLWGMGVADEVLFPTKTVLFVGQIIGVISTDNPDIIIKLAKVCVYYYFIQHIQLHDCIQELFLMITCMSAVVRVMFLALPEDTSSSLVPFFLYLDRSRENVKNVMLSP